MSLVAGLLAALLTSSLLGTAPAGPDLSVDALFKTLNREALIPGTSLAIDGRQVVIGMDDTVTGPHLAWLRATVEPLGDRVRVVDVPGEFARAVAAGQAIHTPAARCSLGFNVRNRAGDYGFLTAGHCLAAGHVWYAEQEQQGRLGVRKQGVFPGSDYGIVAYDAGIVPPGSVHLYPGSQDIRSTGKAFVGQQVQSSGSTTGMHSGQVTGLNVTVTYGDGQSVFGTVETNMCAAGGDSGGPVFSGTVAIGLLTGRAGDCFAGETKAFFQPIGPALKKYNVYVY